MSSKRPGSGGGFNPTAEPGKLNTKEWSEINQIYAANIQQIADITTRNNDQLARIIDETRIKWLVYVAGIAALMDICHTGWLAARFVFKF